jgi:hypothetical protein
MDKDDLKKEALIVYVNHLAMWEELSDPEFYVGKMEMPPRHIKRVTIAMSAMGANDCEFCHFDKMMRDNERGVKSSRCAWCPAEIRGTEGQCLKGNYLAWSYEDSLDMRARIASEIKSIELNDWFKELIS